MADSQPLFDFMALPFPAAHFRVGSFKASERLSKPYSYEVNVTSPTFAGELERVVIGQRAAFVSRVGKRPRAVHGVVDRAICTGLRDDGSVVQHRIRVVPHFALLKHVRGSRIF